MMRPSKIFQRLFVIVLGIIALSLLAVKFIDGHGTDYAYFFPKLLDSYAYYKEIGLQLHEYTVSMCAGIFVFANPQSLSLSFTQWLLFFFDPIKSAQITFVFFSLIGGFGTYLCAKNLKLSEQGAIIAGIVFTFSGFFLTRMMIGHLSFQGFILTPLSAALLFYSLQFYTKKKWLFSLSAAFLSGLLLAFAIYSGVAVLLPLMLFLLLALATLHALLFKTYKASFIALFGVYVTGFLLAAPKIEASLAVVNSLPRGQYPLPGFHFLELIKFFFESLFWAPSTQDLNQALLNKSFSLEFHEYYIGLTPLVLLFIVASFCIKTSRRTILPHITTHKSVFIFALFIIIIPLSLNFFNETWHLLLKKLPIIGQSSNLLRWEAVLIPFAALLCGYIYQQFDIKEKVNTLVAGFSIVSLCLIQWYILVPEQEKIQGYKPQAVVTAWQTLHFQGGKIPPTQKAGIQLARNPNGSARVLATPKFDHSFIQGYSNVLCYEPLFGYKMERFSFAPMRIGDLLQAVSPTELNLKNPACYVYPEENSCKPGDHFKQDQKQVAIDFMNHQPLDMAVSKQRLLSGTVARISLIVVLLTFLATIFFYVKAWLKR